jgi:Cys-rich protein (TIGR01571 family)
MARPYSWNHGLFGCCDDVGACLLVTCCPCVAAGKVAEHVGACCGGPRCRTAAMHASKGAAPLWGCLELTLRCAD